MEITVHQEVPNDAKLREQWNTLLPEMERPEIFYTHEWAVSVSRAYAAGLQPLLITAHEGARLKGAVALAADASRKKFSFLAASTGDYCDFVSAMDDREEFIRCVMSELRRQGAREICLANMPADSVSQKSVLSLAKGAGYSTFQRVAYRCARVSIGSLDDRTRTHRSSQNRLKRMSKLWARHGEITVHHHHDWEGLSAEFQDFTVAHVQRFLATGRTSNLISSERRAFLLELGRLLARQGWLALSTLKLNGRTVAWNFGFRFAGKWFWYQPAFDIEIAHLSPGSYLLSEVLRGACEDPETHTVDLGLGEEGYKQRYLNSGRLTMHITASSPVSKLLGVVRYRSAELVKRSPRVEQSVRALVAKATHAQQTVARDGTAKAIAHYAGRAAETLIGTREVSFFECTNQRPSATILSLQPISNRLLARAVMEHAKDAQMVEYAIRSAERLTSGNASGYALTTEAGTPVHFCWVAPFEGFYLSELRQVLKEPAPNAVLLFDCWTPSALRGKGYYGGCIAAVANLMLAQGKRPWIFSAASNASSLRGIEKSGFVPRFSLKRCQRFFLTTVSSSGLKTSPSSEFDLYPAA